MTTKVPSYPILPCGGTPGNNAQAMSLHTMETMTESPRRYCWVILGGKTRQRVGRTGSRKISSISTLSPYYTDARDTTPSPGLSRTMTIVPGGSRGRLPSPEPAQRRRPPFPFPSYELRLESSPLKRDITRPQHPTQVSAVGSSSSGVTSPLTGPPSFSRFVLPTLGASPPVSIHLVPRHHGVLRSQL